MGNETVFTLPVQLRRYSLPSIKGGGWGIFVIGSDGYFSCVSDYGDYAFFWTHAGMEFRRFLVRTNADYVAGKLAHGLTVWSADKTVENIKDLIVQHRRGGDWTKEQAREEWDLLESNDFTGEAGFIQWTRESSISDAWELASGNNTPTQIVAFSETVFARFQQVLRDELAAETLVAEPATAEAAHA